MRKINSFLLINKIMEELLEFISLLLSERSFKLDSLQIFVLCWD